MHTFDEKKSPEKDNMSKRARLMRSPCVNKSHQVISLSTPLVFLCCLLVIFSGCVSLFSGVTGGVYQPTPDIKSMPTPTPTPSPPLTDSDLAHRMVQGMSLDQKLGQMVIVEFYGATLNSDLIQMIQGNRVSGVLIENMNGNAQTRDQLIALNKAMQGRAHIPLFITTDFEGGVVNELRRITGERPSESTIGATRNPQVAYNAGHSAATDLTALGLNVNFMPIVDVLTNPNNPGLPDRTFGSDPTLVTNMGRAYLKGLTDGGVIGCLKHFPVWAAPASTLIFRCLTWTVALPP